MRPVRRKRTGVLGVSVPLGTLVAVKRAAAREELSTSAFVAQVLRGWIKVNAPDLLQQDDKLSDGG